MAGTDRDVRIDVTARMEQRVMFGRDIVCVVWASRDSCAIKVRHRRVRERMALSWFFFTLLPYQNVLKGHLDAIVRRHVCVRMVLDAIKSRDVVPVQVATLVRRASSVRDSI